MFEESYILITGGTGTLGNALTERLLKEECPPDRIIIFSRGEEKQHEMRLRFRNLAKATDEIIYDDFSKKVQFIIGDIRDYHAVRQAIRDVDIIFHAAALKQVPVAEYSPKEAIKTNITGAENLVSAIAESGEFVETVIGISSDKACYPVNAYGMTKALMERVFIAGNLRCPDTNFLLTRYGNVMGSTGSVLPLFRNQIENGQPLTVTSTEMTRFMMDIQSCVDTIFHAYKYGGTGSVIVPRIPAARIYDVAQVMAEGTKSEVTVTGIRPGEKLHETLISEEEMQYVEVDEQGYFHIRSMLPELFDQDMIGSMKPEKGQPFTSQTEACSKEMIKAILTKQGYL